MFYKIYPRRIKSGPSSTARCFWNALSEPPRHGYICISQHYLLFSHFLRQKEACSSLMWNHAISYCRCLGGTEWTFSVLKRIFHRLCNVLGLQMFFMTNVWVSHVSFNVGVGIISLRLIVSLVYYHSLYTAENLRC